MLNSFFDARFMLVLPGSLKPSPLYPAVAVRWL